MNDSLKTRFLRWLSPDQRHASRHCEPPLIAYLGMVRTAQVYEVGDISTSGFYMLTGERWVTGTELPVTLQKKDTAEWGSSQPLSLPSKVVRTGPDGVGFAFIWPENGPEGHDDLHTDSLITRESLEQFLESLRQ